MKREGEKKRTNIEARRRRRRSRAFFLSLIFSTVRSLARSRYNQTRLNGSRKEFVAREPERFPTEIGPLFRANKYPLPSPVRKILFTPFPFSLPFSRFVPARSRPHRWTTSNFSSKNARSGGTRARRSKRERARDKSSRSPAQPRHVTARSQSFIDCIIE